MCLACRGSASTLLLVRPPADAMSRKPTQVWPRLQQLGGQGEPDGSEVGHAYESARSPKLAFRSHILTLGFAYFLRMPKSVLNFELSSGALSTGAVAVIAALDASCELSAGVVVVVVLEPGRALCAASSAMSIRVWFSCQVDKMKIPDHRGSNDKSRDVVGGVAVRSP